MAMAAKLAAAAAVDRLGVVGVNPLIKPAEFIENSEQYSPFWGPRAAATANIDPGRANYGSIDLWKPFYAKSMSLIAQGQAIIHEPIHLVSQANDVFLARVVSGGKWQPPPGKGSDRDVVEEAAGIWQAGLIEKCK